MKKEAIIILVLAIIVTIAISAAIYFYTKKKKNTGSTEGSKTVQDYVSSAAPGEQEEAKKMIDQFKDNINGKLSENMVEEMLEFSDNQLSWAAVYYAEQTGKSLSAGLKGLPMWGWSSVSFDDNHLIDRLSSLGL